MYLASLFIILQVLSTSLSHETESENLLRKEQEYLNYIPKVENQSLSNSSTQSKAKLPKKFSPNTLTKQTSIGKNNSNKLTKYIEHIKRQGVKTLNYIGKDIVKNMNQEDANFKIKAARYIYMTKLQNYLDYISGPKSIAILDKEFVIQDVCEIACRILYHQQRKMLTDYIAAANLSQVNETNVDSNEGIEIMSEEYNKKYQLDNIKNITETIFKYNTNLRKDEMSYICKKYKLCRQYPGLSDYFGYFINEILKLPSGKFQIITRLLGIILRLNDDVIAFVTEITNYDKFVTAADTICNNETTIKKTLDILKPIFSQKFNIIRNPVLDLNMRASAIRILLDVIDRSFDDKQHEEFVVIFDKAVTAIRKWAYNEITSIALDLGPLLDRILRILNLIAHSDKTDRKHLIILIEIIREGNSAQYANNYVHKKLL